MGDQIGVSGNAFYRGIPSATISYTAGSARTLDIFTEVSKEPMANVSETDDNSGELLALNRVKKRIQFRASAKPHGAARSNAVAIAADLPYPNTKCTITCSDDAQVACDGSTDTCVINSASGRYTPEGEFVVDLVWTKYIGIVLATLS